MYFFIRVYGNRGSASRANHIPGVWRRTFTRRAITSEFQFLPVRNPEPDDHSNFANFNFTLLAGQVQNGMKIFDKMLFYWKIQNDSTKLAD